MNTPQSYDFDVFVAGKSGVLFVGKLCLHVLFVAKFVFHLLVVANLCYSCPMSRKVMLYVYV